MRDELDRWIDDGLAEYAAAEPLAGIEERVLQRVRSAKRARRWWWMLVPVAAVVAALAMRTTPVVPPPPVVASVFPPAPRVVAPAPPVRRVVKRTAPGGPPKRNVFPTISPLTAEERLLVQLARTYPEQLSAAPMDEIAIKPIEIAPLDINNGQ
jgi:hypothetical protein